MPDPHATNVRTISVQSTAKVGKRPLWSSMLVVGLRNAAASSAKDPLRTPTLRLLAHEDQARPLTYSIYDKHGKQTGTETIASHHTPLIVEAAIRPARAGIDAAGYPSSVTLEKSSATVEAALAGDDAPYDLVTLAAQERIDEKITQHIRLPPFALTAGSVGVLLHDRTDHLCAKLGIPNSAAAWADAKTWITVFGTNSGMRVAFVKRNGKNHVPVALVPDGLEIDVTATSPFDKAVEYELRLRIILEDERYLAWPTGDSNPNSTMGYAPFCAAFDALMSRFSTGNRPLALSWNKEGCAIGWLLGKAGENFAITAEKTLAFRNNTLEATLISDREPASPLAAATEIAVTGAQITNTARERILIINPDAPKTGDVTITWPPNLNKPPAVEFPGGLNVIAETAEFGRRVRARYEAAHLLPSDPALLLHAFFPLERGLLQLPLPFGPEDVPEPPPVASAIQGPVRVAFKLNEHTEFTPRLVLATAAQVQIVARLAEDADRPTVAVIFQSSRGIASGFLFAAASSPRDGEMLPDLSAGPIAAESLDLIFGEDKTAIGYAAKVALLDNPVTGIAVTLKGWSAASCDIPLGALTRGWLAHPRMALVSSFPMTRTHAVPGRPSETRDLVAFELDATADDKRSWKMPLVLTTAVHAAAQSPFPTLSGFMAAVSPSWPWPQAGDTGDESREDSEDAMSVSLASLTLAGVEYGEPSDNTFADMRGSLRFDLPIHGELFASASLPQPKGPGKKEKEPPEEPPATALRPELIADYWRRGADRIALSRTMNDRISGWIAPDSKKDTISVTGLVEPYHWEASFALLTMHGGLPLGEYVLEGKTQGGPAALQGWSGTAKIGTSTAEITGFSAQHRDTGEDADTVQSDTRGVAMQKSPQGDAKLEWRKLTLEEKAQADSKSQFLVTAPLLEFTFGGEVWGVRLRDLPCVEDGGTILFNAVEDGKLTGLEGHLGPRGSVFKRAELPFANYEWSLFETAGRAFSLPLGPFRFRPLRLAELTLSGLAANAQVTGLTVIGNLEPPGDLPTPHKRPYPFVDDDPYAMGNPIVLHFAIAMNGKASLEAIGSAEVAAERIAIDLKAHPEIVLHDDAALTYNGREGAEASDPAAPFALRLTLAPANKANNEVAISGFIDATLFGSHFGAGAAQLAVKPATLQKDLIFDAEPSGFAPPHLDFKKVKFTWDKAKPPQLDLEAAINLSHQSVNEPVIQWSIGRSVSWFGVTSADMRFTADHRRGALTLDCADEAPAGTFLEGFPQSASPKLHLSLAISSTLRVFKPGIKIIDGFLAARLYGTDVDIRHSMHAQLEEASWLSRIIVSLPPASYPSEIRWPLMSLPDLSGLGVFAPSPASPDGWMEELKLGPAGEPFTHSVRANITDAELDISLIAVKGGKYVLARPWHFRAKTHHVLHDPTDIENEFDLSWTGVDEIVIVDAAALVAEAEKVIGDIKINELEYGLAARYFENVRLHKADAAYAPTAGVLNRALARAGLPTFEMLAALASAPKNPPTGLIAFGASILEIEKPDTGLREGHTAAMPWFMPLGKGTAGVLAAIPQAAKADSACLVSTFDLAARIAHRLPDAPPVRIAARDRSVAALVRTLDRLTLDNRCEPFSPVSQAISQSYEDLEPPKDWKKRPAEEWRERPIWLRTIVAWRAVYDWWIVKKGSTFHDRIAIVLPDVNAKAPHDVRVLRVASTPDDGTAVPADESAPEYDALILARDGVHRLALNSSEITWANGRTDAAQRRRITRLALGLAAEPLAIAVGAITDNAPEDVWPTYDIAAFLDLPAALAEPGEGIPLRQRRRAIFGSPAVAWPQASQRLAATAPAATSLGAQQPLQDKRYAWAGEARSFAVPARSFGADPKFERASVLAIGQRALFRRPKVESGIGPPDRALMPIPPRARLPLPGRIEASLASIRLRDEAGTLEPAIAPIQPGSFEVVTTGRRPGALFFHYDGLLFASEDAQAFDTAATRFGRPADRGPAIWRQVRSPRSTAYPAEHSLARRRQTFIEDHIPTDLLSPMRQCIVTGGPMAVLRIYPPGEPTKLRALLFRPQPVGSNFVLDAAWDGTIVLNVSGLDGFAPTAEMLAGFGILQDGENGLRATLAIGGQKFLFDRLAYKGVSSPDLTFTLPVGTLPAAKAALAAATADTRASFMLECGSGASVAPQSPITLEIEPRSALKPGPLRVLAMDISLAAMDRPYLPVQRATLAFGDPAYDRELASKTNAARLHDETGPIILALDRLEYDSLATLHFAFGRVTTAQDADVHWYIQNLRGMRRGLPASAAVIFSLIRESAPDETEPLALASVKPLTDKIPPVVETMKLRNKCYAIHAAEAYAVALNDLRKVDPKTFEPTAHAAEIAPGDRLQIAVLWETHSLAVEAAITAEPVIAPPASVYGLATIDGADAAKRLTSALFASAPLPQIVEYPDLLGDLAKGMVRRRGLFVWPFMPRVKPPNGPFASLIKIDRTGGGQLPDGLTDFVAPNP
ncbi:MAG: hypothetical protein ACKVP5_17760 [Aestuariivirga sp.]